jgi:D-alanyl-D-alanine dipeptidase
MKQRINRYDLVDLAVFDPRLLLDIRYASADNFCGRAIYPEPCAWLQRPAAEALRCAHDRARKEGYGFTVFDAYRPWHITRQFWEQFPAFRDFLADPAAGSVHNRGCAVDLSLFDLTTGMASEMPSNYDEFTERAYPEYAGGSSQQRELRDRLRTWMEAEGFAVHPHEWWHYNYKDWERYPVMDLEFTALRQQG